jgi:type IV secretory pathway VirB9-like protein
MRLLLLTLVSLLPAWMAFAQPIVSDSRIKTLVYNPNEVFTITTHYGYQANIEFGAREEIETVSVGDRVGWQIVPAGRRLFIRAMEENAHTNMTVITSRHSYQFDLRSSASDAVYGSEELVYVVRFFYPEEGGALPSPMLGIPMSAAAPSLVLAAPAPQVSTAPLAAPAPAPQMSTAPLTAPAPAPQVSNAPLTAPAPAPQMSSVTVAAPAPAPQVSNAPLAAPEPSVPIVVAAPAPAPEPAQALPAPALLDRPPAPLQTGSLMPPATAPASVPVVPYSVADRSAVNYRYTYTGPSEIAPVKIFDDGTATYFKFRPGAPLPRVTVFAANGEEISVPYQINAEGFAVVNIVAPRFALRENGYEVVIYNEAKTAG